MKATVGTATEVGAAGLAALSAMAGADHTDAPTMVRRGRGGLEISWWGTAHPPVGVFENHRRVQAESPNE